MIGYEKLTQGKRMSDEDICLNATQNVAFVQVQLATQTLNRINRSIKVSTADMISNFGKKKKSGFKN